jgi:hypothetical protein
VDRRLQPPTSLKLH